MRYAAIVLFLACLPACAQSAKVIQLSPADAAQAARLADEQKALDERRQDFRDHVTRIYLVTTDPKDASPYVWADPATATNESDLAALCGPIIFAPDYLVGYAQGCESAQEKAARKAADKKAEQERDAYLKAHPTKYLKQGWQNPGHFEFSDDFKFIVPAQAPVVSDDGAGGLKHWVQATSAHAQHPTPDIPDFFVSYLAGLNDDQNQQMYLLAANDPNTFIRNLIMEIVAPRATEEPE